MFLYIIIETLGILLQYLKLKEKSTKSIIINIPNISQGTLANMANMSKQQWGYIAPKLSIIGVIFLPYC